MEKQIYPDGVDYEGSTCYHRLVTELFISATLLCLKNSSMFQNSKYANLKSNFPPFPSLYMERLEKMIEFVMYYTKPDSLAPQIGDNDDGRAHILSNYGNWNKWDHTYLISAGAILFANPKFKNFASKLHEETFWLFGLDGLDVFHSIPNVNIKLTSKGFSKSGIYIMRHNDTYVICDCIQNKGSKIPKGHLHNSRLSFELYTLGATAIVDPGTYVYTPDPMWRNRFRSTGYHNTIMIDGDEQNNIYPDSLFSLEVKSFVKVNLWESTDKYDILDAEHSGYNNISVTHRRTMTLDKENLFLIIKDSLLGPGNHYIEAFFHTDSLNEPNFCHDMHNAIILKLPKGNLALVPFPSNLFKSSIEQSWISYSYGTKVNGNRIHYYTTKKLPISFYFFIFPISSDKDILDNTKLISDKWILRNKKEG